MAHTGERMYSESGNDSSESSSSSEDISQQQKFIYPDKRPGKKSKKFNRPDLKEEKRRKTPCPEQEAVVLFEPDPLEEDRNPNANPNLEGHNEVSAGTSTPAVCPCDCPTVLFYNYHYNLGPETRHQEFKEAIQGDWNKEDWRSDFAHQVGTYMCGFLNSGGGVMYWGVNDMGQVVGVALTSEHQAEIERIIEMAFGDIKKRTDTGEERGVSRDVDYIIRFPSVKKNGNNILQAPNKPYVLVEVCVRPCETVDNVKDFYQYRDQICVRRDGSLQRDVLALS